MSKIKPTLKDPATPHAEEFQDKFKYTMKKHDVNLNEVDEMLSEKKQTLKKKIFNLSKMESLVHADPKLSSVYDEMALDGKEKYGYHYNETILNIIFNEYVLNSPKYLQKYKQAIPKEKKRRDAAGIKQLRDPEKKDKKEDKKKVDESTESSGSGAYFQSLSYDKDKVKKLVKTIFDELADDKNQSKTNIKDPNKKKGKMFTGQEKKKLNEGEEKTRVVFLVNEKDSENPDVFAYFPDDIHKGNYRTSYSHIGQHSASHPDYAKESRLATPEEYEDLKNELENQVGYNLEIVTDGIFETTSSGGSGSYAQPLGYDTKNNKEDGVTLNESVDQKGYTYYVLNTQNKKIESGWEYLEDAHERNDEIDIPHVKVYTRNYLKGKGIDPTDDDNWANIEESSTTASVGGTGMGSGGYATPRAFAGKEKTNYKEPQYPGGDVIGESYLTNPIKFKTIFESLDEHHLDTREEKIEFISNEYEDSKKMTQTLVNASDKLIDDLYRIHEKKSELVKEHHLDSREDKVYFIINYYQSKDNDIEHDEAILKTMPDDVIDDLYNHIESEMGMINEKAKSPEQQKFFGLVRSVQKGETPKSEVTDDVVKAADDMSAEDVEKYASTSHDEIEENINEAAELPVVEYDSDMSGEKPFELSGIKWEFVNAIYPDGKKDIGVYRFDHDIVYDYEAWKETYNLNEKRKNKENMKIQEHHLETKSDRVNYIINAYLKLYPEKKEQPKFATHMEGFLNKLNDEKVEGLYLHFESMLRDAGKDSMDVEIDEDTDQSAIEAIPDTMANKPDSVGDLGKSVDMGTDVSSTMNEQVEGEWIGVDLDLETSLLEYGVIAKQPKVRDYDDEWFVIYKINEDAYGSGWIRDRELNAIIEGNEWANDEDIESFLSYVGIEKDEWLRQSFILKMNDLLSYWGAENIMGTDYDPMSKEIALAKLTDEDVDSELNEELKKINKQHKTAVKVYEDRKPSALVIKDRMGDKNVKNFKQDMKDSVTKDVAKMEKELGSNADAEDVTHKEQQKETEEQAHNAKFDEVKDVETFKNVGDSTNKAGDEIPKRNLTTKEQEEVDLYRKGLGDYVYDNEPSERFEERMKKDMGEELYDKRQDKMEFNAKAPMYNKDSEPVDDGIKKSQYNKQKSGWADRYGINESNIVGKYHDQLNKRRLIDFKLNEVKVVEKPNDDWLELNFDGLGNRYNSKLHENDFYDALQCDFYTDGKNVWVVETTKSLNENVEENKKDLSESMKKINHLFKYNPSNFVDTKSIKRNRGF